MSLLNPIAAVARVTVLSTKTVCHSVERGGVSGRALGTPGHVRFQVVCQLFLGIRSRALEEWTSEETHLPEPIASALVFIRNLGDWLEKSSEK